MLLLTLWPFKVHLQKTVKISAVMPRTGKRIQNPGRHGLCSWTRSGGVAEPERSGVSIGEENSRRKGIEDCSSTLVALPWLLGWFSGEKRNGSSEGCGDLKGFLLNSTSGCGLEACALFSRLQRVSAILNAMIFPEK
jgi:hypothetical protein